MKGRIIGPIAFAVLLAAQQNAPSPPGPRKPQGVFDEPSVAPSHGLKSAGIRGTIDAGGYAASANVKTQTEFFEQLVQLQSAVLRPAWDLSGPCSASAGSRRTAIALLARGEYASAAAVIEKLLRASDNPGAHQLLGLAYEGLGQLEAAVAQFGAAARARPSDTPAAVAYSVALLLEGDAERAESVSRIVFEQDPDSSDIAPLSLGAALFQEGKTADALHLFEAAANARPSSDLPFEFMAVALRSADPASVRASIQRLRPLAARSNKGSAHYALACALAAAQGAQSASPDPALESELKRAVALTPLLAHAHLRLGSIYAAREELPSAVAEYRAALESDPGMVEAHYRLGQLYTRCGWPELARKQLDLYTQLRAQQKSDIESGKVNIRRSLSNPLTCP